MNTPADVASSALMMAAMMLPTAVPFFAASVRHDGVWSVRAVGIYFGVWCVFGAVLVLVAGTVSVAAALAVGIAYACLPFMWRGRARCIALCRASGGGGFRYAVSCVECSAGLMLVVLALGMTDMRWMAAGAVGALLLKL